MEYTNELIHETNPYLLQHAHNPVNWQAWHDDVLAAAKKEDKMLLISIGYAACHWCHVMAHESFENKEVADYMNQHFVCIKVDREERPDVDKVYMAAAQMINGNGGWPLNAIALPNGKPFFAATYFPRDQWMQVLQYFVNEYAANRKELEQQAESIAGGINKISELPLKKNEEAFTREDADAIFTHIASKTDKKMGGLTSQVKFPMPSVWEWLLGYHHLTEDAKALSLVELTLDRIKDGGICDQLGGGFARYSTDPYWHAPHFEKMLYDNAQFISLYSHAWQITGKEAYRDVVQQTIEFLKRELYDGQVFYSSLDADSEGEEGKYYVWTYEEVKSILGSDADMFCKYYGIIPQGNWQDGKNIPDRNWGRQTEENDKKPDISVVTHCHQKMMEVRNKRVPPALDNKVLTAWNAMTISALFEAARALDNSEYAALAEKALKFLTANLWDADKNVLYRNYQKGERKTTGFLDDYAFLIKALTDHYQYSFDVHTLLMAGEVMETVIRNFSDPSTVMFYYNDTRFNSLIARSRELDDNVLPAPNSVMAENLLTLGTLLDRDDWKKHASHMVSIIRSDLLQVPTYYSNWGRTMLKQIKTPYEVAVIGDDLLEKARTLQLHFAPDVIYCGSLAAENLPLLEQRYKPGKTMIYVCQNKACRLPVEKAEDALEQVKN